MIARPGSLGRLLATLVGLALVLTGIVVGAVPAAAQDRVGASTPAVINSVGSSAGISAGQRLGTTVLQPGFVVATGVAAETESGASSVLRLSPEDNWGNPTSLARHFRDHGADFGATSAEDYANQASQFLQRSQRDGLPTKIDSDGVIRVYDPETNTFGSFSPDGTTKTFFTPKSGIDYWNRQPGSPPWTGQ